MPSLRESADDDARRQKRILAEYTRLRRNLRKFSTNRFYFERPDTGVSTSVFALKVNRFSIKTAGRPPPRAHTAGETRRIKRRVFVSLTFSPSVRIFWAYFNSKQNAGTECT